MLQENEVSRTKIFKEYLPDRPGYSNTVEPLSVLPLKCQPAKLRDTDYMADISDYRRPFNERRISATHPVGGAPKFSFRCHDITCEICSRGGLFFIQGDTENIEEKEEENQHEEVIAQQQKRESEAQESEHHLKRSKSKTPRSKALKTKITFEKMYDKDVRHISAMLAEIRKPNKFTIEAFEPEDKLFRYELNSGKELEVHGKEYFQYHPKVRRIPKFEAEGRFFIQYEWLENKEKVRHVLKDARELKKRAKPSKSPEGLCPYCEDIVFAEFKNSTYFHHLNKQHGVFSNGFSVPTPASYGMYKSDDILLEAVQCCDCSKIIPLGSGDKQLLGYLRHYSDEHKRGSKLDHKIAKTG